MMIDKPEPHNLFHMSIQTFTMDYDEVRELIEKGVLRVVSGYNDKIVVVYTDEAIKKMEVKS